MSNEEYQHSEIQPLGEIASTVAGDSFPSTLGFVVFIAGVFLISLLFPALVYYSVVTYGLLASVFMAAGLLVWRSLSRTNPKKATGFLIGCLPVIVFTLVPYAFAAPGLVTVILGEFLLFIIVLRALDQFRLMR